MAISGGWLRQSVVGDKLYGYNNLVISASSREPLIISGSHDYLNIKIKAGQKPAFIFMVEISGFEPIFKTSKSFILKGFFKAIPKKSPNKI